jgi:VanZ family protein
MRPTTWLAIGWTLLIVVLCWTPREHLPASEDAPSLFKLAQMDKVLHAALFAGFAFLWRRATSPRSVVVIAVSGIALAVITELGQATALVGRDADLMDGVADTAGTALGLLAAALWESRRVRHADHPGAMASTEDGPHGGPYETPSG